MVCIPTDTHTHAHTNQSRHTMDAGIFLTLALIVTGLGLVGLGLLMGAMPIDTLE